MPKKNHSGAPEFYNKLFNSSTYATSFPPLIVKKKLNKKCS